MGTVSNRFFVTSIEDGTVVNAAMYSDKTLSQLIGEGTALPNWETDASSRPVIYCITRKGATMVQPAEWAYSFNGSPITFTGTPVKDVTISDDGCFMYTEKTVTYGSPSVTVTYPAIKPLKNIDDLPLGRDNNTVSCSGNVAVGTASLPFDVSMPVRKTTLSSSGYFGWIDGDSFVVDQSSTATMKAYLYNGSDTVTSFSTEWNIEGETPSGWPKTAEPTGGATYAQTTIAGYEFTDYAVVRVDFYDDSSSTDILATAYWGVDDREDAEEMYICSYDSTVRGGLDVSLRSSQQAQFVIWMGKRGSETTVDTRYTHFYCKILNSKGEVLKTAQELSSLNTPYGAISPDANGWFEITNTNGITEPVTAAKAGQIIIPATFATTNGGKITGIVKATS